MQVNIFSGLIVCYLLQLIHAQHSTTFFMNEVVKGFPENNGRTNARSEDPSVLVPHLYMGDVITIYICPDSWMNVSFTNLTYSNDGPSDQLTFSFNGQELGQFETIGQSDWGKLWDNFHGSGHLGHTGIIPSGQHEIAINVTRSDCYGVEIGTLYAAIDQEIQPARFWCGFGHSFAPTRSSCLPSEGSEPEVTTKRITTTTTTPTTTTTEPPTLVTVEQKSSRSDCLDKKNVGIGFTSRDLTGTRITVKQSMVRHMDHRQQVKRDKSSHARFCETGIWQLGQIDDDNKEFLPLYPGPSFVINITNGQNLAYKFPAKILPFVTKDITINFDLSPKINIKHGTAFFALGFVNLTKKVEVGLQYFDHTINAFSDIHYITFTPRWHVMGWNIQNLGKTKDVKNMFILHIDSDSNVVMFDFLKLEFSTRDERPTNILISKTDNWKIRGMRYNGTVGITVSADSTFIEHNIETVVLLNKVYPLSKYQHVLSIHADGHIYPYKTFGISRASMSEKHFVDVSGLVFGPTDTAPIPVHSVDVDTVTDSVIIHYQDGSSLHMSVKSTLSETQLIIVDYETQRDQMGRSLRQTMTFVSTHVTDYLAAVNKLTINGLGEFSIMDDLSSVSRVYDFTFKKTSPSTMYYANEEFKIQFPSQ